MGNAVVVRVLVAGNGTTAGRPAAATPAPTGNVVETLGGFAKGQRQAICYAFLNALYQEAAVLNGVSLGLIRGTRRWAAATHARHQAWWTIRSFGISYPEIGTAAKRDHSTIIAGVRRAKTAMTAHERHAMLELATRWLQEHLPSAQVACARASACEVRARMAQPLDLADYGGGFELVRQPDGRYQRYQVIIHKMTAPLGALGTSVDVGAIPCTCGICPESE